MRKNWMMLLIDQMHLASRGGLGDAALPKTYDCGESTLPYPTFNGASCDCCLCFLWGDDCSFVGLRGKRALKKVFLNRGFWFL
jgi:hypothetical protein